MIRVAVAGVAGKMGKVLAGLVVNDPDMELVGATEAPDKACIGENAGDIIGHRGIGVQVTGKVEDALVGADVFIDFTSPEATIAALKLCKKNKIAAIIGATGLDAGQKRIIAENAKSIPVVLAPNMSLGVNLLAGLVAKAAKALGEGYDIEIIEAHHRQKVDAPSGTALMLARAAAEARGMDMEKACIYGRKGKTGARPDNQIGVMTLRGGDIVGEHTVMFAGPGERLELTHRAHSRETFARGALRATRWVVGKKPGLYSMMDVLGLNE